jgi:hypothetical protein
MNTLMQNLAGNEKAAIMFHGIFTVLCVAVLALPIAFPPGQRLAFLVAFYLVAMLFIGLRLRDVEWLKLLGFCLILSVFQVFPDWFLSAQLNILVFPEDGFPKIGSVSGYMAGLWTIPLFIIIFTGWRVKARFTEGAALMTVAAASLLIFGVSEETVWMIPSWYAKNVTIVGHTALYILVPEILLGLSAYLVYEKVKGGTLLKRVLAAFFIMTFYIGNSAFFYFLVERIIQGK